MTRTAPTALGALALAAALVGDARAQDACELDVDCATVQPVLGAQPCPFELRGTIDAAANAALAAQAPALPRIHAGCAGGARVAGRVPCQILRAFAYARTGWRQFCAEECGPEAAGLTRVGVACGIGLMGISASDATEDVDLGLAAQNYRYNAGAGALRLARAWEASPCVGTHDPDVAEHWYFAVWAADAFTYANNPNNPSYPVLRGAYRSVSSLDRDSYPFQEVVFGLTGIPPLGDEGLPLWDPSPVNLPDTTSVCGTAACLPANIDAPEETHDRDCPPFVPPRDGGIDSGVTDAGPEDGGGDAGTIVPDPHEPGCDCGVAGARGTHVADGGPLLLLCTALVVRGRRRRQ